MIKRWAMRWLGIDKMWREIVNLNNETKAIVDKQMRMQYGDGPLRTDAPMPATEAERAVTEQRYVKRLLTEDSETEGAIQ